MKYCHRCGWSVSADDGLTRADRSQKALEHYLETGHTIDSTDSETRPDSTPAAGDILVRQLLA